MTREQQLEVIASDLDHALRTMLVAITRDPKLSGEHQDAYMTVVAIPRAREAVAAYALHNQVKT